MIPYELIEYDSWAEFVSSYSKDIFEGCFIPSKYIFRGQGKAEWKLISSFDRVYGRLPYKKRNEIENCLLQYFLKYCKRDNISVSTEDIKVKGLAQHYGVPTRLLDWSSSPFVAAYFAFSSTIHNSNDRIAIWALDINHDVWNSDIGVSIKEDTYSRENAHMRKQLGCFTIINNQASSLEGFLESCHVNGNAIAGALKKITIPNSEYRTALYELEAMDINAMSIYGGLEGCAQASKDMVTLLYSD